jgi:hypothetical protein
MRRLGRFRKRENGWIISKLGPQNDLAVLLVYRHHVAISIVSENALEVV